MPNIDDALRYNELALCVIPICAGKKTPVGLWKKYQRRRPTTDELRTMFDQTDHNLAIVCGDVSAGLIVRDFDSGASYEVWKNDNPSLAKVLPTVATARGFHVYALANGTPTSQVFEDGELRGNGSYVLAPHSRHPDGPIYSWEVPITDEIPKIELSNSGFLVDFPRCNTVNTDNTKTSCVPVFTVLQAIERTVATKTGTRNHRLFQLARELKAIPETANASLDSLREIVQEWHRRSLPMIRTKEFEESWFDFLDAWKKVKYPAGQGPIEIAFERAKMSPTPECAREYESPKVVLLVKLCRELQRINGDKPFFLDCRKAGELLGIDHVRAWRFLKGFVDDEIVSRERIGSIETRRASEFRYLGD